MRVVSGIFRGLKLETIVEKGIRPTTDKVKEAVFDILQFEVTGKRFLDLFGGSGQIGIEAASRGAREVIIVEKEPKALEVIKRNVNKVRDKLNISVINSDAFDFLTNVKNKIDIAFLDPPYKSGILDKISYCLDSVMNTEGIIITETAADEQCKTTIGNFKLIKSYSYGNIMLNFYKFK
jgi:RNA methyltransferase, RsmD family